MDSDLGAKVKKLRIAHGLTQEDVAKALEVTPGSGRVVWQQLALY